LVLVFFSSVAIAKDKVTYANIYADELIKAFDKSLDVEFNSGNILNNPIYAKILAARDYIENSGTPTKLGKLNLLNIIDSKLYNNVVDEINKASLNISFHQNQIVTKELSGGVLYPSASRAGNVTGNTFPRNVWSLTFDDGPRSGRTEKVVDNLYNHQMKATFFMLMREAKKYKKSVNYVLNNDMELALHSYNHLNLNKATSATINYEVGTALKELEAMGNQKINLFRLPYGAGLRNTALRTKIAENKLIHVFWNVDTLDWKDKNPKSIFARTVKQMKATPRKSGVILFHDIHPQTVIASELVMGYLNDNSKTVCLLGDIIRYLNAQDQDCV
jgi:peptidoglycan/xylan/chitin deacetylase (PgdA/CDA1 family)